MREVARHLGKGFVLTVDYGYPAEDLYSAAHRRGTLLCYYKQTFTEDPFVRVGQQDITAHVDFTALTKAGKEEGLKPLLLSTQRDYLFGLGLPAFIRALEQKSLGAMEYRRNRLGMEELVKEGDLGRLRVLIQTKGLPASSFSASDLLPSPAPDSTGLHVPLLAPQEPDEFINL